MARAPLIPDVGVIAMVADDWGPEWMSRHQILTRLAEYFRIVWVNPSLDWRQTFRRSSARFQEADPPPGFQVYEHDFWLPRFYRPSFLANYTFRERLRRARNLLLRAGCSKIVLYVWRPEFAASLDAVPFDLSCYHIVDEYSFSDVDLPNSREEEQLLRRVNLVFVHTRALREKKGSLNSSVTLIPNGVAYRAFSDPHPEPQLLRSVPHPRVGYAGYLKRTLDWNLLLQLSAKHPEFSFVFVGAQKNDELVTRAIAELSRRPNVHLLGPVTTAEMPRYPQHFDVCIMPYVLNDYTNYVYPLKLHEYLASGRPVVGSPTRLLKEFREVIYLCNGPQEWSAALARALRPESSSSGAREQRQAVARQYDWDLLANSIAQIFSRHLGVASAKLPAPSTSPETACIVCS
jgi:glycosyltransferase involved in cell wall biosynthesis